MSHVGAEAFHVSEYINDECEARGWSRAELAERMGGDTLLNYLVLELCEVHDPRCLLGEETANGIAKAFGTSAQLWLRLDESWRNHPTIVAKATPAGQAALKVELEGT